MTARPIREKEREMTKNDYTATISAKITAKEAIDRFSRVWDWWARGFTGASQKPGDNFTIRFGETFVNFTIVEVIPEKRIVWQVTNCNLHRIRNKTDLIFTIALPPTAATPDACGTPPAPDHGQ
jgi:hypothetical protein